MHGAMSVPVHAAVALALAAQVVQKPLEPGDPARPAGRLYPQVGFVPLSSIAFMGENFQNRQVRTRGVLFEIELDRYYVLTEQNARVLVLAVPEIAPELDAMAGKEIDVRGVVRRLRMKQYQSDGTDRDLVENPDLPPLPDRSTHLPPFSITVLAFTETAASASDRHGEGQAPGAAAALLAFPPKAGTRPKVVLTGQFRGRNLLGDLPAASQRGPTDWVLKEGDTALWVTGRPPRGKGFSLDPGYKGDTARWLEVTGTAEVAGGILYVTASRIQLAKPPTVDSRQ